jgi:hypothetical protein
MTDDKRMDEIIEVADKISAAAEGHTNAAVLYALVNHGRCEHLSHSSGVRKEQRRRECCPSCSYQRILGSKASEGITPLGASLIAIPYVVAGAKRAGSPRQALST